MREPASMAECDDAQKAFVLENFIALREEIVARIGFHQRLMWGKIAACGVFVAFLLTSLPDESLRTSGFAVVPGVAIVFDFLIGKNVRAIHCLGIFIRDRIEKGLFGLSMWETHSGQVSSDKGVRNYGPTDAVALGVTTAFLIAFSMVMVFRDGAGSWAIAATAVWLLVFTASFYKVAVMVSYSDGRHMDRIDRWIESAMGWSRSSG